MARPPSIPDDKVYAIQRAAVDEETAHWIETLSPIERGRVLEAARRRTQKRTRPDPARLHVRGISPDLKAWAKARAEDRGQTVGEYVVELILLDHARDILDRYLGPSENSLDTRSRRTVGWKSGLRSGEQE